MAHWRPLDAYTPFGQALVEYMWAQRPPLLPAQFAARMGVRKQALSSWLSSDATPPPRVVVQLARAMGLPVADLLIAAGHATEEDPLFDTDGAWALVLDTALQRAAAAADADADAEPGDPTQARPSPVESPPPAPPVDREALRRVLAWLQALQRET